MSSETIPKFRHGAAAVHLSPPQDCFTAGASTERCHLELLQDVCRHAGVGLKPWTQISTENAIENRDDETTHTYFPRRGAPKHGLAVQQQCFALCHTPPLSSAFESYGDASVSVALEQCFAF